MPHLALKLTEVAYHRNGICGAGFYAVAFKHRPEGRQWRSFVATVFPGDDENAIGADGLYTVLDAGVAAEGVVTFGLNSWRGDEFINQLRVWITEYRAALDAKLAAEFSEASPPPSAGKTNRNL